MIVKWTFCTSIIRKPRNNFYHKVLWMDNLEGGKTFKKKKKTRKELCNSAAMQRVSVINLLSTSQRSIPHLTVRRHVIERLGIFDSFSRTISFSLIFPTLIFADFKTPASFRIYFTNSISCSNPLTSRR